MDQGAAKAFILEKMRKGLPKERSYHSFEHTMDVYASAITIAEEEGVMGDELELIKTAALFHDSGFLIQDADHEEGGCTIARKHLPDFGYDNGQVEQICAMIMATKIPQKPFDLCSEILCDADLDYLGRSDFRSIGSHLFEELQSHGSIDTEREWNLLQEGFLSKHDYFTRTSKRLREPVKQEHLSQLREWLKKNH